MIKNHGYLEFPDIHRYSVSEGLSEEVLVAAFKVEEHYHRLLLSEKNFDKRVKLYDEFYSKLIPIYGRDTSLINGINDKDKYVKLFAKELENASVVDYGSGQGYMLQSIERHLKTKSLTGIDVVIPKSLKSHKTIRFIESNIVNYEFDEKFDVAFSDNVLEHLVPEDADIHLKNIYNHLNPNGKLIIIMPNRLFGPWDVTRIKDFSQSGKLAAEGGHVNESTHTEMANQLKKIGFREVSTILPIPKLKYSLFKRVRIATRWVEAIENNPILLRLFRSIKLHGVCQLKFPVILIAKK
ncbi:class I SAM-dependent methyltransferase [Roseivirga sp.]|uniref:class I SAM-dependent methyltransferase n=1 Tax=Roseivirga sp. TaxID=1964215 RepID=UPI002B26F984|nr:class I SAM-dependent methyltransferase [Roseivirga sp.]